MLWSSASIAYSGEPDGRRHQLEVVRTGKWANGGDPEPAGRLERQKATHRRHRNSSFRHPSGSRICRSERPLQRDAQLRLEGFRDNLCELDAPEHKFRTFLRFSPSRSTSPMIFSLCPLPYMVAVSQTVHPCVVLPSVSYGSDPLAGRSRTRRPSLTATHNLDRLAQSRLALFVVRRAVREAHPCDNDRDQRLSDSEVGKVLPWRGTRSRPIAPKPGSGSSVPSARRVVFGMLAASLEAEVEGKSKVKPEA